MNDYSILHRYFEKITNRKLSDAEKTEIDIKFKKKTFKKKEFLFRSGDSNTRHYYIEKGLVRLYVIDKNGKEFNILFAHEKQWIGDLGTPGVTSFCLEALENSEVFSISETEFRKISNYYPDFVNNIRRSYIFLQKRLVSIISNTAEENYEELYAKHPKLIKRLPQYHISSYLGVTPVFLSKILSRKVKN